MVVSGMTYTPDITTGRMLVLPLEDQADPTEDISGQQHDADVSATGSTWETEAPRWSGGSTQLQLDGSSGMLSIDSLLDLPAASGITLSLWLRLDAVPSGPADVVSLGNVVVLRLTPGVSAATVSLAYQYVADTWHEVTTTAEIPAGYWVHLAATVTAGQQAIFVNGTLWAQGTAAETVLWTGQGSSTVFGRHALSATNWLQGTLDDVAIFARVLTPGEVAWRAITTGLPGDAQPTCTVLSPTTTGNYTTSTLTVADIAGSALPAAGTTLASLTWACPLCAMDPASGTATDLETTVYWGSWSLPTLTLTPLLTQTLTLTATTVYGTTGACQLDITQATDTVPPLLRLVPLP
jgi:hypothetical protein